MISDKSEFNANAFKTEYLNFLKNNIDIVKINDDIVSITTPFLDSHNDYTEIFVINQHNGEYLLTDDGYTISDLELSGFEFNSSKRNATLNRIVNRYGVSIGKGNALQVLASLNNMPMKKHMLVQCMASISELYILSHGSVLSYFIDDVSTYFDTNEIRHTDNINILGKSGLMQNFDFIISKTKKQPERIIKLISTPNNITNIKAAIFSITDIQGTRKDASSIVIINDTSYKVKSDQIDAFQKYDIFPILWK